MATTCGARSKLSHSGVANERKNRPMSLSTATPGVPGGGDRRVRRRVEVRDAGGDDQGLHALVRMRGVVRSASGMPSAVRGVAGGGVVVPGDDLGAAGARARRSPGGRSGRGRGRPPCGRRSREPGSWRPRPRVEHGSTRFASTNSRATREEASARRAGRAGGSGTGDDRGKAQRELERGEADQREDQADDPEADDDRRLGPAELLEMVVDRRHPEHALAGALVAERPG